MGYRDLDEIANGKTQEAISKGPNEKSSESTPKAKNLSKAARGKVAAKRAVARAKPKRAPVKKVARPVAPAVEAVAVEVIEQPAPDIITVAEAEGTELSQAS